jgi:carbamoyltransferase
MGHDTGAAVVDGNLNISHIFEEERFNGEKMTYFNPYFSLKEIFKLGFKHFKTVSFGFNPDESQATYLKEFVRFQKIRCTEVLNYLSHQCTWDEVRFVGHHDCHAAGAFFPSGFDQALILVADGTGESESTSFYKGLGNKVEKISAELTHDFSIGILYQYFTEWLGYRDHNTSQHCGKIMGLSSYGSPIYKERIREILIDNGEGYQWPGGSPVRMRKAIIEAFGVPQTKPVERFNQLQADVASSIQALIEKIMIEKLAAVKKEHPYENLCFSGGVAMNSLLNYRILKAGIFKKFFVQPLASDRGIALGAALSSSADLIEKAPASPRRQISHVYLGYGEDDVREELNGLLRNYDFPIAIEKEEASPEEIARRLADNQIISLFQGREEAGPRALGNRSIMAAPTIESRDKTNTLVKYREPWRPFAPTVLEEEVHHYFDFKRAEPFMTVIYGVLEEARKDLGGITHVDGTARLQTVSHEQNPLFHAIIKAYQKVTGIPIILNTSFNINGQPIIRTLYDAVLTFLCSGIDALLIGNSLIRKRRNLPKENINALDRILYEATRNTDAITLKILDVSKESEALLKKFLDCACIKYRKQYGEKPFSRCYLKANTKMSWNIISRLAPAVKQFIYEQDEKPVIDEDEICVMISGKHLIEGSSRPRSYVGFDRSVFRDLIQDYYHLPHRERYYLLDRDFHLFDMAYLHARFESQENMRNLMGSNWHSGPDQDENVILPSGVDSMGKESSAKKDQEELYETLSEA